ncbi:MAG: cell division protein FtsA [Acidobacteria bacterium]|jgi:cell division protein FtsA|nr:MAG: cell division protein FtsA [Acidobacteriota bacterium]
MKLITALDMGTSKVVALAGEIDTFGDIHIIGVGETPSKGIDRGYITRLDLAVNSVLTALKEAQEMAGAKLSGAVLGISGPTLKSQNERDTVSIASHPVEIDYTHIERIIDRAIMRAREEGYEIVSAIPRRFILDEQEGVMDPIGLLGSKLSAEVHVIKVGASLLKNIEKVLHNAGLNVIDRFLSPLASSEAVLTSEEKEEGALMLDMGAGLTDFVVFLDGSVLLTGSVPMGGMNITKDIAHFMKINNEQAERIKIESGYAIADLVNEAERIKIKPRGEEKEITVSRKQLAEVIQIRLEEIMERVSEALNSQGVSLDSINAGIVITGGCAKLAGIKELLERYFDLPVRIGHPMGVIGLKEKVQDPTYATSVGLLKLAHKSLYMEKTHHAAQEKGAEQNSLSLSRFIERVRSFFKDIL